MSNHDSAPSARLHPDAAPSAAKLGRGFLLASLGTLILHLAIQTWVPGPEPFQKYPRAASLLLQGELSEERLLDFSPAYLQAYLLAARTTSDPQRLLLALQTLGSALSAGLLWILLRRRFATGLAWLGVILFALDRRLLIYQRILEPEILLLLSVLAVLVWIEGPSWRSAAAAGLAAALAVATRANLLPLFLLMLPWLFWLGTKKPSARWARMLAFGLPLMLALCWLGLRSHSVRSSGNAPPMAPGTVFFEGNNGLSLGTSAVYPPLVLASLGLQPESPDFAHQAYRDVARAERGEELSLAAVNGTWARRALHYLRSQPGAALSLLRTKLVHSGHGFRWHDVPSAWAYDRRLPSLSPPWGLLSALALLGLLLWFWPLARRARMLDRLGQDLPLAALLLLQLAVMLVFYVSARQQLLLLPAVTVFALHAVQRWRRRGLWPWLLTLLVLTVALSLSRKSTPMADLAYQWEGYEAAQAHLQGGRHRFEAGQSERQIAHALAALSAAPWARHALRPAFLPAQETTPTSEQLARLRASLTSPSQRFDLASLYLELGELEAAEDLLRELMKEGFQAYRRSWGPSYPEVLLARCVARQGHTEEAQRLLDSVLRRRPGDPFALAEHLVVTGESASWQRLRAQWGDLDAAYLVGTTELAYGRYGPAAQLLRSVVSRLPGLRPAWIYLAVALGGAGDLDAGARAYLRAVRLGPEPVIEADAVLALFRNWQGEAPERPDRRLFTAQVLRQLGQFEEGLALLEDRDFPASLAGPAQREIKSLQRALGRQEAAGPAP